MTAKLSSPNIEISAKGRRAKIFSDFEVKKRQRLLRNNENSVRGIQHTCIYWEQQISVRQKIKKIFWVFKVSVLSLLKSPQLTNLDEKIKTEK